MKCRWITLLFLSLAVFALILFPTQAVAGAAEGLRLCAVRLIPALLPFLFLLRLLTALLPPFHLPRSLTRFFGLDGAVFSALLLSFLGSYPCGIAGIVSLYENGGLKKKQAENALVFCNNSGPAFFIAVVGIAVLKSVKLGLTLYAIHCFSAFLCARIFSVPFTDSYQIQKRNRSPVFATAFSSALSAACTAMLQICTLVVLFSVLSSLLQTVLHRYVFGNSFAFLIGLFEITAGITRLSGEYTFVLAAFLMGWGGICVHLQAMTLWQPAGLRPQGYYLEKLLHGLFSALLALATLHPSALTIAPAIGIILFCTFYPYFLKNKAGNYAKNRL